MESFSEFNTSIEFLFDDHEILEAILKPEILLQEKSRTAKLEPQVWGDISSPEAPMDVVTKQATEIYNKAAEMAKSLKDKFMRQLKTVSRKVRHAKVLVDVKSIDSFLDKVINRGKLASKITDVLRSAIILSNNDDVDKVVKQIKKDFVVVSYESKDFGEDKEYGYFGSHHFLVKVGAVISEIQVMTKKLWAYKHAAHKIYTKFRSLTDADDAVKKAELAISKRLFKIGNKGRRN